MWNVKDENGEDGFPVPDWIWLELWYYDEIDYWSQVELKDCSEEELGLKEEGKSKFYPLREDLKEYISDYFVERNILKCFDQTEIAIKGPFENPKSFLTMELWVDPERCIDSNAANRCVLTAEDE